MAWRGIWAIFGFLDELALALTLKDNDSDKNKEHRNRKKCQRTNGTFIRFFCCFFIGAHDFQLQNRTSQRTTQVLQKSPIFHLSGFPIITIFLIYWRFFDFKYSPKFRSFGKNWN
jgi:hypothetical protein